MSDDVKINVSGELDSLLTLDRQLTFAAAQALTRTAKEAQKSAIATIQHTFTTRSQWYMPGNRFGVRITSARKDNLVASVHTDADWLALHEEGGVKERAGGGDLAVPIVGGARSNPRAKIRADLKPRALGNRAFVINTANGPVLFYRKGARQKLTALYNLEPRARIRKASVIFEPTEKVVELFFGDIFERALQQALETAK